MAVTTDGAPTPMGAAAPRRGGLLWRISRATRPVMSRFAGRRSNPLFAVVEHVGRRSGRGYATPVAARRSGDGFIISLAFGAQVDWYRNLLAAGGGSVRWRDRAHPVAAPVGIDPDIALAAFNPIQRLLLRVARIDGFIWLADAGEPRP